MRRVASVALLAGLAGCALLKETPQQAYVWEKGRLCDNRVAFWKMERVDEKGNDWVRGATNAPPGWHDYRACMDEEFAKDPYEQWLKQHADTVRR